jgi:hypothetical protein
MAFARAIRQKHACCLGSVDHIFQLEV